MDALTAMLQLLNLRLNTHLYLKGMAGLPFQKFFKVKQSNQPDHNALRVEQSFQTVKKYRAFHLFKKIANFTPIHHNPSTVKTSNDNIAGNGRARFSIVLNYQ